MVITRVKNGSPDMILVAFERKFDEKKDEIPPGICRPHIPQIIQYGELSADIKPKNGHKWGPPGLYFGMHLSTISPKVLTPKVFN